MGIKTVIIILLILLALFCVGCNSLINGFHSIQTTFDGKHTGYVTAVQKTGLIFKTTSVYFKTELESSQEDKYCVTDPNVINELIKHQKEGNRITLHYDDYFIRGWKNCNVESVDWIKSIEITPLRGLK